MLCKERAWFGRIVSTTFFADKSAEINYWFKQRGGIVKASVKNPGKTTEDVLLSLDKRSKQKLDQRARRCGMSTSDFVRNAVQFYYSLPIAKS